MTDKKTPELVLNPKTGRYVRSDTRVGKKASKANQPLEPNRPSNIKQPEDNLVDIEEITLEAPPIKQKLVEFAVDVIKDNKKKFQKELTNSETDALLRRLLYERLCLTGKEPKKDKKAKKKGKFKIKNPPPSPSSSESESEESE